VIGDWAPFGGGMIVLVCRSGQRAAMAWYTAILPFLAELRSKTVFKNARDLHHYEQRGK
jgi:hypothetical protein